MIKKGKWTVPGTYGNCLSDYRTAHRSFPKPIGYKEKFGDLSLM